MKLKHLLCLIKHNYERLETASVENFVNDYTFERCRRCHICKHFARKKWGSLKTEISRESFAMMKDYASKKNVSDMEREPVDLDKCINRHPEDFIRMHWGVIPPFF